MSCPDCGSPRAVSKEEAWDAACTVPAKARKELEDLWRVAIAAQNVLGKGFHSDGDPRPSIRVSVEEINTLRNTLDIFKSDQGWI